MLIGYQSEKLLEPVSPPPSVLDETLEPGAHLQNSQVVIRLNHKNHKLNKNFDPVYDQPLLLCILLGSPFPLSPLSHSSTSSAKEVKKRTQTPSRHRAPSLIDNLASPPNCLRERQVMVILCLCVSVCLSWSHHPLPSLHSLFPTFWNELEILHDTHSKPFFFFFFTK